MEALEIRGLSKNFGALQVFNDLDLSVAEGECLGLIGPNGAGKTTLLNVISGVLPSSSGRVRLCGRDITNAPMYRRAHLGLARSFQITRIFRDISVLDNLMLALHGTLRSRYDMFRPAVSYQDIVARAQQLLESVGLWQRRDELAKNMSYGEQKKIEIALALSSAPKVLLLDEPTAGLDIAEIPEFVKLIKAVARGTTVLFSAHDMDVVFGLAERVVVLYTGRIIADGTPGEIQSDPLVKECYLGAEKGDRGVTRH
ncbi:MAG: ABC transporter ATP-binding protein [Betaproteobacteria bacterium]|nr:ABC transporter ATP-binding protein [Betaproteobacteria bacterium]